MSDSHHFRAAELIHESLVLITLQNGQCLLLTPALLQRFGLPLVHENSVTEEVITGALLDAPASENR